MKVACIAFIIFLATVPLLADTYHELLPFDANADGRLDEAELSEYFRAHGKADVKLDDQVDEILTGAAECPVEGCQDLAIETVVLIVDAVKARAKPADQKIGWSGLKFKRSVTDAPDPRQKKSEFPAIFAYKRDGEATDRDQFTFLGAVELYRYVRDFGDPATLPNSFVITPGVELDVDGGKEGNENTVDLVAPLSWTWVRPPAEAFDSLTLGIAPKFSTDRGFDRRVYDVTTTFAFSSMSFARAGFRTRFLSTDAGRPRLAVYWAPAVLLETGEVADAAGNAKLEALEGSYVRSAIRVQAVLQPLFIDPKLALGIRYFHRYDFSESEHSDYGEANLTYDLTPSGSVAFTAAYRRGRKPPAFEMNDTFLFGVGLKQ